MCRKRRVLVAIALNVAGFLAATENVNAGQIAGKVFEKDGTTAVTDFEVHVFDADSVAVTTTVTITGNSYSFTVTGSQLPSNKAIRIEFWRGATRSIVRNVNGAISAPQTIDVTIGVRTIVRLRDDETVYCCQPRHCRMRCFAHTSCGRVFFGRRCA